MNALDSTAQLWDCSLKVCCLQYDWGGPMISLLLSSGTHSLACTGIDVPSVMKHFITNILNRHQLLLMPFKGPTVPNSACLEQRVPVLCQIGFAGIAGALIGDEKDLTVRPFSNLPPRTPWFVEPPPHTPWFQSMLVQHDVAGHICKRH